MTAPVRDRLRLVRLVRYAPLATAAALACRLVESAVALLLPIVLARTVDAVIGGGDPAPPLLLLAGLLVLGAAGESYGGLASTDASTAVTARLRKNLVRHAFALGIPGLRRFESGDLVARVAANATAAGHAVPALGAAVLSFLTTLGGLLALWLLDWRLGAVFLAGAVPAAYLLRRLTRDVTDRYAAYLDRLGAIAARLGDALAGARTIRASGTARREAERVLAPLPELREAGTRTWDAQRSISWQIDAVITVFRLGILAVAGIGVAGGWLSPGGFLAAAMYLTIALGFLDQVDNLITLAEADANTARVAEVLSAAPMPRQPEGAAAPAAGPGRLSFRGVRVRHGDRTVLDGVDLDVPPGTSVAVVGRSGAGKSTLALLAGGLVAPDAGRVSLDGTDLAELPEPVLRREFAYAFDVPVLLGGSVGDAIGYGCPGAAAERLAEAAATAYAADIVDRLPAGYDTPLSAVPLSGGETQRLGLARALVRESRVLVLDDATSSLDTVTEARVAEALTGRLAGRTRLVIAHRAGTAARADLVAWLEDGRVRALAPHRQLWTDEPEYRAAFADGPGAAAGGVGR